MFKPDKKHLSLLVYGFTAMILIAAGSAFLLAPKIAHEKIVAGLKSAGLNTAYITKPRTAFGAMLYSDLKFDENGFTTMRHLRVTYNPFVLFFTRKFHDLDIIDLNVMGDWANEQPESLSFAGWTPPTSIGNVPLTSFEHISISGMRISMLTKTAGGMSVFADAELSRKGKKIEFQGNVKSEQQYLSLTTGIGGLVDGNRWYCDAEIAEGKFESPAGGIKATRMNGWLKISSTETGPPNIMGQLQAGGLSLYDLAWQNASSTVDYKNGDLKLFTEAKATGFDGVELELNLYKKMMVNTAIAGAVHADTKNSLASYLKGRERYASLSKQVSGLKTEKDVSVDFLLDGQALRYEIKAPDSKGAGIIDISQ